MMSRMLCGCMIVMAMGSISACALWKTTSVNSVRVMDLTAEHRLFVVQPGGTDQKVHMCSEPSPDIAKALSDAFTQHAELALNQAGGQSEQLGESLVHQSAQAIARLGRRFATVQIIRDIMYNECLAYANGMLPQSVYAVTRPSFDAMVVTLLATEMLSGEDEPPLPPISSPPLTISNSNTGTGTLHVTATNAPSPPQGGAQADGGQAQPGHSSQSSPKPTAWDVAKDVLDSDKAMADIKGKYKSFVAAVAQVGNAAKTADVLSAVHMASDSLNTAQQDVIEPAYSAVTKAWDAVTTAKALPDKTVSKAIEDAAATLSSSPDRMRKIDTAKQAALASGNGDALKAIIYLDGLWPSLTAVSNTLSGVDTSVPTGPSAPTPPSDQSGPGYRASLSDKQAEQIAKVHWDFLQKIFDRDFLQKIFNEAQSAPVLAFCTSYFDKFDFNTELGKFCVTNVLHKTPSHPGMGISGTSMGEAKDSSEKSSVKTGNVPTQ